MYERDVGMTLGHYHSFQRGSEPVANVCHPHGARRRGDDASRSGLQHVSQATAVRRDMAHGVYNDVYGSTAPAGSTLRRGLSRLPARLWLVRSVLP